MCQTNIAISVNDEKEESKIEIVARLPAEQSDNRYPGKLGANRSVSPADCPLQ
jgi:hypothetical protein